MKNLLYLLLTTLFLSSCEPKPYCTEPECVTSPLNFKTNFVLNDTSSILQLGDTLKFYARIPDTIQMNYEGTEDREYITETVENDDTSMALDFYFVEHTGNGGVEWGVDNLLSTIQFVKGGFFKSYTSAVYFEGRELEFNIIPPKKGRYYIASRIQSSRVVFKEKNKDWLLAMMSVGLAVEDQHHDLYLSWIQNIDQYNEAVYQFSTIKEDGYFWYSFEVK